jgi:hypothetical protein
MRPTRLSLVLLSLLAFMVVGCNRTVDVEQTVAGLKKVPLAGAPSAKGKVLRPIRYRQTTLVPEGAEIRVEETWLVRTDGKNPPGYRMKGLYDPTQQTDGLMLPRHSVETYYYGAVLPDSKQRAAIPERWFEKKP